MLIRLLHWGMAQPKALGMIRILDTQPLFINGAGREKILTVLNVPGSENPAGFMTKPLDRATQDKLMVTLGLVMLEGRAAISRQLAARYSDCDGAESRPMALGTPIVVTTANTQGSFEHANALLLCRQDVEGKVKCVVSFGV